MVREQILSSHSHGEITFCTTVQGHGLSEHGCKYASPYSLSDLTPVTIRNVRDARVCLSLPDRENAVAFALSAKIGMRGRPGSDIGRFAFVQLVYIS